MTDVNFSKVIQNIPLLLTRASPRDKKLWIQRLKEEYKALIKYAEINKANDLDWFRIESNEDGTRWWGICWIIYNFQRYEFKLQFEIPVTYPMTAVEVEIPELEGKTAKMYRGGKVCLTTHFNPLWIKSQGKFGIAHILALGLSPWLAVEIPEMIEKGLIKPKSNRTT